MTCLLVYISTYAILMHDHLNSPWHKPLYIPDVSVFKLSDQFLLLPDKLFMIILLFIQYV